MIWEDHLKKLSPFPYELRSEMPHFIKKALDKALRQGSTPVLVPIRPRKLLGITKTGDYPDCPNLPIHHIRNSKQYDLPSKYLNHIGKYFWFDFDIHWPKEDERQLALPINDFDTQPTSHQWRTAKTIELRMVVNEGDADCNDGTWGAVWERKTQELIANILSTGDCETTVHAVSEEEINFFSSYPLQFKTYFSLKTDYSLPCSRMIYKENSSLEIMIGLAIRWCFVYSSKYSYESPYGFQRSIL